MTREKAKALIDAIVSVRESATDEQASNAAVLYPTLKGDGSLIEAGTRINWKGEIKRAAVSLWDTDISTPDAAPDLWEDITYKDGFRIIPEVITATLAFAKDECGWWKDGKLYRSKIPANVYTPEQYADGWEEVST